VESDTDGKLLVFEGGDGIGKSHLSKELAIHLKDLGVSVLLVSFPGRREGSLGDLVYRVHHDPKSFGVREMVPLALQALHIAAHLDEITSIILPALRAGTWVVLDRFWWSTWVYGVNAGAKRETLELLITAELATWNNVRPAIVLVVERERAIHEEQTHETFRHLAELYSEIRSREEGHQPTHLLNNNDMNACTAELLQLADDLVRREGIHTKEGPRDIR
jgi:thymidylate kinase